MTLVALLDTNIVSAIMRDEQSVVRLAHTYILEHQNLSFSLITRYEILRGLVGRRITRRQAIFDQLCAESDIVPLSPEIIDRAAYIYADLNSRGLLISDADILIGATALVNNWRLVTDNERHLRRIPDLIVENWLAPA